MRASGHMIRTTPAPVLLLLAGILACGPTPPPASPAREPPERVASLADLTGDLLALEETSLAGFRQAFGEPEQVLREPIPNRHVPGQIDTALTVIYAGARFQLYQVAGGRTLLEAADVTHPRFLRWRQPGIGTPEDSVVAWLGPPMERADAALVYEDPEPPESPLIFHIRDGRVARIERAYYVD